MLATQCLLQRRPKTLAVEFEGALAPGVTAKDLILALIARIGIGGATGHVHRVPRRARSARCRMEERMTVCNMSIEAGARAGMVAPDDTTYRVPGRPALRAAGRRVGRGASRAGARCRPTTGAAFDRERDDRRRGARADDHLGHEPRAWAIPVRGVVPDPAGDASAARRRCATWASSRASRCSAARSTWSSSARCTNSRLGDLREAAQRAARPPRGRGRARARGARLAAGEEQAEAEGLDRVFRDAGAEWREPGCSMCIAMNGDRLRARPVRGEHQQPQLRRPPGPGRPHLPGEPARPPPPPRSRARSPTRGSCSCMSAPSARS